MILLTCMKYSNTHICPPVLSCFMNGIRQQRLYNASSIWPSPLISMGFLRVAKSKDGNCNYWPWRESVMWCNMMVVVTVKCRWDWGRTIRNGMWRSSGLRCWEGWIHGDILSFVVKESLAGWGSKDLSTSSELLVEIEKLRNGRHDIAWSPSADLGMIWDEYSEWYTSSVRHHPGSL